MRVVYITKKNIISVVAVLLLASVVVVGALSVYSAVAPVAGGAQTRPITSVQTSEERVALTIELTNGDLGLEELLGLLERESATATFCVTGEFARRYSQAIYKIHQAGHEIVPMTFGYVDQNTMTTDSFLTSLASTKQQIEAWIDTCPNIYRPTTNSVDNWVSQAAWNKGFTVVTSSVTVPILINDPKSEANGIAKAVSRGAIITLQAGTDNAVAVLPYLLESLKAHGFEVGSLSQLLFKDNFTIDGGGVQIPNPGASENSTPLEGAQQNAGQTPPGRP